MLSDRAKQGIGSWLAFNAWAIFWIAALAGRDMLRSSACFVAIFVYLGITAMLMVAVTEEGTTYDSIYAELKELKQKYGLR